MSELNLADHLPLLTRFALALACVLLLPRLVERLRMPGPIGFLLAGLILGPHGFGALQEQGPVLLFFADLGKLLLMFFAGFEVDADEFARARNKSALFGALSFALPFLAGTGLAFGLGYSLNAACLIGSILASHTLLGLTVVKDAGLVGRESVMVTIGATVFTDILAILVLAICIPVHETGFSMATLAVELVELAIFVPAVLIGLAWIGRVFMTRYGTSSVNRTVILLLLMAVAAQGAEWINLEGIIGAFLAGIAARRATRGTEGSESLDVVSRALFIPAFFLAAGFLIDPVVFFETIIATPALVVGVLAALLIGKYLAARAAAGLLGYSRGDGRLMFALSVPQVAATLAVALVAYSSLNPDGQRLVDESVLNATIVLVIVTSVLGFFFVDRSIRTLEVSQTKDQKAQGQAATGCSTTADSTSNTKAGSA
jgi:Kef-type K+ transport system membrane component KefB